MSTPSLRPELKLPMPARMQSLPVMRGYPVPWFVAKVNGEYDFRIMDPQKYLRAVREHRCWTCGDVLGRHLTFVAGPMCGINRTSSEPANHLECAEWSVQNCPFLTRPNMVRREDELTAVAEKNVAGYMIKRNPGVTILWTTRSYKIFRDANNKPLINFGEAEEVSFWREGRLATREEVIESVDTGMHFLEEMAAKEKGGLENLAKAKEIFVKLYPKS